MSMENQLIHGINITERGPKLKMAVSMMPWKEIQHLGHELFADTAVIESLGLDINLTNLVAEFLIRGEALDFIFRKEFYYELENVNLLFVIDKYTTVHLSYKL